MEGTKYYCPACRDTGFIFTRDDKGQEFARKCKCISLREARERLEKSGLAREFQAKSFASFDPHGLRQLTEAKERVMRYADTFASEKDRNASSLMLCGQVGAGKTHLGTACSMQLIEKGIAVTYMGYREEMTALKAKIMNAEIYTKAINRYKLAAVLFIDDFLKGKTTEADINVLYEIVNYRYNNHLPIILSTEKGLDDLINFDEAIGSRLIEMCRGNIIVFQGSELNYRLYRGGTA